MIPVLANFFDSLILPLHAGILYFGSKEQGTHCSFEKPMSDATNALQKMIKDGTATEGIVRINLQKGDYMLQTLEIPKNSTIELFSKDKVRILYSGKRNRPLFVLEANSTLTIREKIEIYYNTNNVQEVMKLMIREAPNSRFEISKGVKVSLFSYKPE